MRRHPSSTRLSDELTRYRVKYSSDPCFPNTDESRYQQYQMIQTLIQTPDFLRCGPVLFQKMSMSHNGEEWVIELESVVREEDGHVSPPR